jgi:hypothetical protein
LLAVASGFGSGLASGFGASGFGAGLAARLGGRRGGVLGGRLSLRTGLLVADGVVAAAGVLAPAPAWRQPRHCCRRRIQGDDFGLHVGADLHRLQARGLGLGTVGIRPDAHAPRLAPVDGGRFGEARQLRALQVGDHRIGVGLAAVGAEGDREVAGGNRRRCPRSAA